MWKDVIKVDDKKERKERWDRYRASQGRGGAERKPKQPRFKCAMCGRKLSRYDKEHNRNQLNFCKTCKKARGN